MLELVELQALAFHEPKRLSGERARFRARIAIVGSIQDALAEARDIVQAVHQGLGTGGNDG